MNRRIICSLCALLSALALCACGVLGGTSPPAQPAQGDPPAGTTRRPDNLPEESPEAAAPETSAPEQSRAPLPDDEPAGPAGGEITIYLYRQEENNYFPMIESVGSEGGVDDILDAVVHVMGLPAAYEAETAQAGGQIVIDFPGEYIDACLTDHETETAFLNTLSATLVHNVPGAEWIELRRDGGAYRSAGRALESGGAYAWPELVIGGGTVAEYAQLRASVDYEGMRSQPIEFLQFDIVPTDETGRQLTRLLARVGDPGKRVDSAAELGEAYILARALENVTWYTTDNYGQSEIHNPALLPITTAVRDSTVALSEHVEQAARELFGDVPFQNAALSPWKWHPIEGVYTPPHTSAGSFVQPVILEYEELGEGYRVELVYLQDAMGVFVDEQGAVIPQDDLQEVVRTQMRRREVLVGRDSGGELVFHSHRYL